MATDPGGGTARISPVAAMALGIGGMMGAGLYTLVGVAATTTGSWLPVAFLLAAAAAVLSVYSYARLGVAFPSKGGAANFIVAEFGPGIVSGGINVFQYAAYLIATSLYAAGFAEYVGALAGDAMPSWASKACGVGIVLTFLIVNLVGPNVLGRAQTLIVGTELAILVGFIAVGSVHADPSRLLGGGGTGPIGVVTGAALLYVTYQGFGVVATASNRMADPKRDLPRAMYGALAVVTTIYVVISVVVVSLLPLQQIVADAGHVLADAGDVVLGRAGFVVISTAAILATSSAVSATLFASANVGYYEAETHQVPKGLTRRVGRSGNVALLVSAVIVMALVLFFPLAEVGRMTSMAFLLVYAAVSAGHLRVRAGTGARAWPLVAAVVVNLALFATLLGDALRIGATSSWVTLLAAVPVSFALAALSRSHADDRPTTQ